MALLQNGVLEDDDLMDIGIVDFNHRRYESKKLIYYFKKFSANFSSSKRFEVFVDLSVLRYK